MFDKFEWTIDALQDGQHVAWCNQLCMLKKGKDSSDFWRLMKLAEVDRYAAYMPAAEMVVFLNDARAYPLYTHLDRQQAAIGNKDSTATKLKEEPRFLFWNTVREKPAVLEGTIKGEVVGRIYFENSSESISPYWYATVSPHLVSHLPQENHGGKYKTQNDAQEFITNILRCKLGMKFHGE